jgi:hypothetical protein
MTVPAGINGFGGIGTPSSRFRSRVADLTRLVGAKLPVATHA